MYCEVQAEFLLHLLHKNYLFGGAMAHAVSRQPLTAAGRVQA
jgi:hypothetical protein